METFLANLLFWGLVLGFYLYSPQESSDSSKSRSEPAATKKAKELYKTECAASQKTKEINSNVNRDIHSNATLDANHNFFRAPVKDSSQSDIVNAFHRRGVFSIWHMTHKNNVGEILRSGILSNKKAYEIKTPTDISNRSVQKWREKEDPIYGRKLHEYAPTYINIKNPMLFVLKDRQHDLCIIEISLSALSDGNFIFTDGNAAARDTGFYNDKSDLKELPWDVLNATYWNSFSDGKRKRCSEVLIYPKIESRHIIKIHCYSSSTFNYLSKFGAEVEISTELFFGECQLDALLKSIRL